MTRIIRTFLTCIALGGCYVVYVQGMGYLLPSKSMSMQHREKQQSSHATQISTPVEHIELAQKYLTDQPWAPHAKIQLRSNNMIFYCGEWKRSPDNSMIRFSPFAIVSTDPEHPEKMPLTIVAESALIEFTKALDLTEIDPRWISRGVMNGVVRVQGDKGLEIVGRDFIFDREANSIRTDHDVKFNYELNSGRAASMEMELSVDPDATPEQLSYNGAKVVHLRRGINFKLREKANAPPAEINCTGQLKLDVEEQRAELDEQVIVSMLDDEQQLDSLHCELLVIQFGENPLESTSQATDHPQHTSQLAETEVKSAKSSSWSPLVAIATGKQLKFSSQKNGMTVLGQELMYEVPQKRIKLKDPDQLNIQILQKEQTEISCQNLLLIHDQQHQLAQLEIEGKGWIALRAIKDREPLYDVQWTKMFRFSPDVESSVALNRLQIDGNVIFRHYAEQSGLKANSLTMWIKSQSSTTKGISQVSQQRGFQTVPVKMMAESEVTIISPKVDAHVDLLEINFLERKPSQGLVKTASNTKDKSMNSGVKQPQNKKQNTADIMTIKSQKLMVAMQLSEDESDLSWEKIQAVGLVEAEIPSANASGPTMVKANTMELQSADGQPAKLELTGIPATITNNEVNLLGEKLNWSQAEQKISIPQQGKIELMTKRGLDGKVLLQPEKLTLTWADAVDFNGKKGRFFGNVIARLGGGQLQTQQLEIELTEPLVLDKIPEKGKEVTIKELICRGQTMFDLYELKGQELMSVYKANVYDFTLNLETQQTTAQGPGWIKSWKYGRQVMVQMPERNNQQEPDEKQGWTFSRVDFAKNMQGNLELSSGTLNERVRALHGPVGKALEEIDADRLTPQAIWLACDLLELWGGETKVKDQPQFEFRGNGNVEIRGELFHAEAQTVTFDQSKQLFVMRADHQFAAMISHRDKLGSPWKDRIYAKLIQFSPVNNILQIDRGQRGQSGSGID